MAAAGSKGFDVTMTTFSTPLDFPAIAALIKNDLAQIGINVNIVAAGSRPRSPPTTARARSTGT